MFRGYLLLLRLPTMWGQCSKTVRYNNLTYVHCTNYKVLYLKPELCSGIAHRTVTQTQFYLVLFSYLHEHFAKRFINLHTVCVMSKFFACQQPCRFVAKYLHCSVDKIEGNCIVERINLLVINNALWLFVDGAAECQLGTASCSYNCS